MLRVGLIHVESDYLRWFATPTTPSSVSWRVEVRRHELVRVEAGDREEEESTEEVALVFLDC